MTDICQISDIWVYFQISLLGCIFFGYLDSCVHFDDYPKKNNNKQIALEIYEIFRKRNICPYNPKNV